MRHGPYASAHGALLFETMRPEIFLDREEARRDTTRRHARLNLVEYPIARLIGNVLLLVCVALTITRQLVGLHGGRIWVSRASSARAPRSTS
jgi:hypothetical protein